MKRMNLVITCACLLLMINACNNSSDATKDAIPHAHDSLFAKYELDKIILPEGFKLSIYAVVENARSLAWGDDGTLFVGNRRKDKVYAVRDEDNDGKADSVYVIASGLNMPNGVAFREGSLYVAEVSRILRYDNIESKLGNPPEPVVVTDEYPNKSHHGWKFISFGPDGKLYVPVGAPCNTCDEKEPIFASITRINPDGSDREIYARGIRNTVGFDWHPETGELWFTENGSDQMGDNIPHCELNHAPKSGMHFGYPYIHQGNLPDPEFGKGKDSASYTPPAQFLGPHVAPLGMRFYTGNMFPEKYKNTIFMALHGSWNRSVPIGYNVMMATVGANNEITSYEPFAHGWLQDSSRVLGRPVDVIVAKDGAMLISDDDKGLIYRVSYSAPN